ncbi:DUF1292 domain-containing protein [Paenibacillus chartarius]|uniref:DUF1292 domain-containing protein n=1 Tax=Paenibacillus chartarius TaxID=747481 RepID=A0ABV6DKF3_9BACL
MEEQPVRDRIAVEDEEGRTKEYAVEALFDMDEESYALLASDDEEEGLILMRVVGDEEEDQYLVGIDNPEEAAAILDAYQVAIEAAPAE